MIHLRHLSSFLWFIKIVSFSPKILLAFLIRCTKIIEIAEVFKKGQKFTKSKCYRLKMSQNWKWQNIEKKINFTKIFEFDNRSKFRSIFWNEQKRIIPKIIIKIILQQGSRSIFRPFGQYFDDFEGSSNDLPEYIYLVFYFRLSFQCYVIIVLFFNCNYQIYNFRILMSSFIFKCITYYFIINMNKNDNIFKIIY